MGLNKKAYGNLKLVMSHFWFSSPLSFFFFFPHMKNLCQVPKPIWFNLNIALLITEVFICPFPGLPTSQLFFPSPQELSLSDLCSPDLIIVIEWKVSTTFPS